MRTFLAGFCAPGGPLAKAVGIFLEKQPLPGDHEHFKKLPLSKNLQHGDANISGGFLRSWRSSGKSHRDFLEKQPLPGDHDPPLGFLLAPGGPLAKAVGIFLEKQPLPGGPRISPLGISKSSLKNSPSLLGISKNLQLGDANISGGFLRSWRSSGKSHRDFP